jgi:hypothetical protein
VLLDENLPRRLKNHFAEGVEAATVKERGWSGGRNGELLRLAEAEFDVFLTADRSIPHQQHLRTFKLAIVVLEGSGIRLPDLLPLIPAVHEALSKIESGQVVRIR